MSGLVDPSAAAWGSRGLPPEESRDGIRAAGETLPYCCGWEIVRECSESTKT